MPAYRDSIQRHLLVSVTFTIILLYSCSAVVIYWTMHHEFFEQMDQHLATIAEDFIAETERLADGSVDSEFHGLGLEGFQTKAGASRSFYQLWDHEQTVILRSPSLMVNHDLPFVERGLGNNGRRTLTFSLSDGTKGRVVFVPFQLGMKKHEPEELNLLSSGELEFIKNYDKTAPENLLYLAIAEDSGDVRNTLLFLLLTFVFTGLALGIASFFLLRKIVGDVCRPIIRIAGITENLGPDNLDIRLPSAEVQEELRPVIEKFNDFIERLDSAIQRERRFSIDIAHELRTPVAEMRALMEVASENAPVCENSDPMEDPATIYQLGATISQRMSRIIETISAIHQKGDADFLVEKEETIIVSIVQTAVENLDDEAQRRIKMESSVGEADFVNTDPVILRAVLDNLISNAIDHSPSHTPIVISVKKDGIELENAAPELKSNDLHKIDEPFWQNDAARTDPNHFGLGLTMVSVYTRLLGCHMDYTLENHRLRARLRGLDVIEPVVPV